MKVVDDGVVQTVHMTFDEYDSHAENAAECGYQLSATWYPSVSTVRRILDNFPQNVLFAIWLLESNKNLNLTRKQNEAKRLLQRGVNELLVLE